MAITQSQMYFQAGTFTLFCCEKSSYNPPLGVLGNYDGDKLPLEIPILTVSSTSVRVLLPSVLLNDSKCLI